MRPNTNHSHDFRDFYLGFKQEKEHVYVNSIVVLYVRESGLLENKYFGVLANTQLKNNTPK
jgi:hypothetical protein